MKTLYALRHGKSSWSDPSLDDFDRPLAPRGVKAAKRIARVLEDVDPPPALALCSTAVRAKQTYETIAAHLDYSIPASFLDELYAASAATLVNALRDIPDDVASALLIGHNPGLQELLILLIGRDDGDAVVQLCENFPTAALATLRVRGEWKNLGANRATLTRLVLPRHEGSRKGG